MTESELIALTHHHLRGIIERGFILITKSLSNTEEFVKDLAEKLDVDEETYQRTLNSLKSQWDRDTGMLWGLVWVAQELGFRDLAIKGHNLYLEKHDLQIPARQKGAKPLPIEDSYTCKKCGAVTKITDYDYKDANLYQSLKASGLYEKCSRGG